MPAPHKHRADFERLLGRGEFVEAKELAGMCLRQNPRDGEAWLAVARCAIGCLGYQYKIRITSSSVRHRKKWKARAFAR